MYDGELYPIDGDRARELLLSFEGAFVGDYDSDLALDLDTSEDETWRALVAHGDDRGGMSWVAVTDAWY